MDRGQLGSSVVVPRLLLLYSVFGPPATSVTGSCNRQSVSAEHLGDLPGHCDLPHDQRYLGAHNPAIIVGPAQPPGRPEMLPACDNCPCRAAGPRDSLT